MKKFRSLILLGSFGLFLAGCASTAHIEKDDAFSFNNYKTFAWVDAGNDSKDIKKNSLQDKKKKTNINADDKLKVVFGGKKTVTMFEMTKLVSKHVK